MAEDASKIRQRHLSLERALLRLRCGDKLPALAALSNEEDELS
jgi:hypothetical protein